MSAAAQVQFVLNTSGEYIIMFGLAYGDDTARKSCISLSQNSRQTFSSFKQIFKERGAFALTTLEQERQRTVWTHDTEYRILYDAAKQPCSNAEGTTTAEYVAHLTVW